MFAHQKYVLNMQYDVGEFINDLFHKLIILQQVLGHEISTVLRCSGCNYRLETNFMPTGIVSLSLPTNVNPFTLQELRDYNFELWAELNDTCSKCTDCRILRRYEIKLINSSLILKLDIFSEIQGKYQKIQNLKIN